MVRRAPGPELIDDAVYGLPELYREQIAGAELVANPGCYPTAAILALKPLASAGLIGDVVIDAKSGVSGAGRAATDKTHFVTVDENVNAYGVAGHRHTPEIEQELAVLGSEVTITFMPHLLPLDQGELVSCYVTLTRSPTPSSTSRALPRGLRRRAVRRADRADRPGYATSATRTSAGSRSTATPAPAARSCSARSTTSGRARPRRPSRTST